MSIEKNEDGKYVSNEEIRRFDEQFTFLSIEQMYQCGLLNKFNMAVFHKDVDLYLLVGQRFYKMNITMMKRNDSITNVNLELNDVETIKFYSSAKMLEPWEKRPVFNFEIPKPKHLHYSNEMNIYGLEVLLLMLEQMSYRFICILKSDLSKVEEPLKNYLKNNDRRYKIPILTNETQYRNGILFFDEEKAIDRNMPISWNAGWFNILPLQTKENPLPPQYITPFKKIEKGLMEQKNSPNKLKLSDLEEAYKTIDTPPRYYRPKSKSQNVEKEGDLSPKESKHNVPKFNIGDLDGEISDSAPADRTERTSQRFSIQTSNAAR